MFTLFQAYRDLQSARASVLHSNREGYTKDILSKSSMVKILSLLLVQLILAIYAVSCLIKCASLLPTWTMVILAMLVFVPDIGILVSIGIITYSKLKCP